MRIYRSFWKLFAYSEFQLIDSSKEALKPKQIRRDVESATRRQESGRPTSIVRKLEARISRAAARSIMKFRSSPYQSSGGITQTKQIANRRSERHKDKERKKGWWQRYGCAEARSSSLSGMQSMCPSLVCCCPNHDSEFEMRKAKKQTI